MGHAGTARTRYSSCALCDVSGNNSLTREHHTAPAPARAAARGATPPRERREENILPSFYEGRFVKLRVCCR